MEAFFNYYSFPHISSEKQCLRYVYMQVLIVISMLVGNTPYACLSYHSFDIAMLIECCIKVAIAQKSLWTSHTSESNFTL